MTHSRLRDIGITVGNLPTGPYNAITDVPDVFVGHSTVIYDEPRIARTGVTMIIPRKGEIWEDYTTAGYYSFNGNGEMTGLHWVEESGMLESAIGITNTDSVGVVRDALIKYAVDKGYTGTSYGGGFLPVVAETWDGRLSDIHGFHIKQEHAFEALTTATSGPVPQGNVGGGTGMICHEFKGGIGTSSRVVDTKSGQFVVGALVQANYGSRKQLRIDGVPVGKQIDTHRVPSATIDPPQAGSIIVIVGTNAPLLPDQCKRLARRATVGLARVGGVGHNGSGDIFLAFSTGNHISPKAEGLLTLQMVPQDHMNPLFEGVAEAVEEAILNALTNAQTMTGFLGHTAYALPLDELRRVMARYRPRAHAAAKASS
jgi:D-aminopeptidase